MSERKLSRRRAFLDGMACGVPIGLGYFAVSFSLGIVAKGAGLSALQGFIASIATNASAGEYAVFMLIAANAPYIETALVTLVTNARYLLMGCALSQRLDPALPTRHRLAVGFGITDELFGAAIARPGTLDPFYFYGALCVASPCWASGTAFGIVMGRLLPLRVVSALGVALYGMFLAVIIPPARHDKTVACLVPVCFALSYAFAKLLPALSSGVRTVILTVALSAAAAAIRPVEQKEDAA